MGLLGDWLACQPSAPSFLISSDHLPSRWGSAISTPLWGWCEPSLFLCLSCLYMAHGLGPISVAHCLLCWPVDTGGQQPVGGFALERLSSSFYLSVKKNQLGSLCLARSRGFLLAPDWLSLSYSDCQGTFLLLPGFCLGSDFHCGSASVFQSLLQCLGGPSGARYPETPWFLILKEHGLHYFFLLVCFLLGFWKYLLVFIPPFVFFLNFILFLNFTILYWFCQISKWIHHRYTCVPHPEPSSHIPPHTIPLGHPSAPDPSFLYPASNLDWQLVFYMILYMF